MGEEKFSVEAMYGSVEPKTFYKFENGRMFSYCYSINRDINGFETSRTEPLKLGSLGYDDGSEFTEEDYNRIKYGAPKKEGFISRVLGVFF